MDFYAGAITTVAVLVSRTFFWDFRRAFGGKRRAEAMSYLNNIVVVPKEQRYPGNSLKRFT